MRCQLVSMVVEPKYFDLDGFACLFLVVVSVQPWSGYYQLIIQLCQKFRFPILISNPSLQLVIPGLLAGFWPDLGPVSLHFIFPSIQVFSNHVLVCFANLFSTYHLATKLSYSFPLVLFAPPFTSTGNLEDLSGIILSPNRWEVRMGSILKVRS